MSRVLSLRLKDEQMARLTRLARRLDRTPSETAARLLEEALRMSEFAMIEFRDSPVGRQAYVAGSRLAAWQVAWLARAYDGNPARVAEHLQWPLIKVQAGLEYCKAFPQEIQEALDDNDAIDFVQLKRLLPQLELFTVDLREADDAVGEAGGAAAEGVTGAAAAAR
jgi:hypothetical protein